ncbi:DUF72 domain-containing protein, partial [Pseudomonas sp. 2995-1]|uniref:DUF72 domain-containing protein n=1 Tax=Pseudomonas sp. 2995-1 TaxID=1712679 RepID=UPI00117B5D00
VRYLYDYSDNELTSIGERINRIATQTSDCFVIFNNNSGGHAVGNAKRFVDN